MVGEHDFHCWNEIFEFSNPVIEIFIHFPKMKFQNTFLVNFPVT